MNEKVLLIDGKTQDIFSWPNNKAIKLCVKRKT